MKKLLIFVLLFVSTQTSYSAEINLNGLKINLKQDQSYIKDFSYKFYLEGSWLNGDISQDMMRIMWDEQKQFGFEDRDKALIIAPDRYLEAYKELHSMYISEGKISQTTLQNSHILQNAIWACRNETSKKKYFKCYVDKAGFNFSFVFAYASNKNNLIIEDLSGFSPKQISREIVKLSKERINQKKLKIKSIKTLIGVNTKGDVFIETKVKTNLGQGMGSMQTRAFFAIVDDRLLAAKVDCVDIEYCKKANEDFMKIFNQVVEIDSNTLTADLTNEKQLMEFIGTAQRAYRAAQIAKFLILLL